MEDRAVEREGGERGDEDVDFGEEERAARRMGRAVGIARALALPHERPHADGESLDRGVEEVVDGEDGVRDGERHVAHASGEEHEDREREEVQHRIDAGRRAEADDAPQETSVRLLLFDFRRRLPEHRRPRQSEQDRELDGLRNDGGGRGAGDPVGGDGAETEDEQVVEEDVDAVAEHVRPENDARAADSREEALHGHGGADEETARHDDRVVGLLAGEDVGGVSAPVADEPAERDEEREDDPADQGEEQARAAAARAAVRIAGAVVLGHERAGVRDDRLEEADEEDRENGSRQHRLEGRRGLPREEHAVGELHEGVVGHAQRERPDKFQHLPVGGQFLLGVHGSPFYHIFRRRHTRNYLSA